MLKLTKMQRKAVKKAVEAVFERYRVCHFLNTDAVAEKTEAQIRGSAFCERIETAVWLLHPKQEKLIRIRYMENGELRDYQVYKGIMVPPISDGTYTRLRERAMNKLALTLEIDCGFPLEG